MPTTIAASFRSFCVAGLVALSATTAQAQQSVARQWDERLLAAIRLDRPRPPVHARNLYHTSAAMYDAWAAYDPSADQVFHHERAVPPPGFSIETARAQAISFAAYRMIKQRYQSAVGAATTLAAIDAQMVALGYNPSDTTNTGDSPVAVGNRVFETIRAAGLADGCNESGNYATTNGYTASNAPLAFTYEPPFTFQLPLMAQPARWQPLAFDYYVEQNGIIVGQSTQVFVCPHWGAVTPFALTGPHPNNVYLNPGPPSIPGTATDADFKQNMVEVIRASALMTPTDGVTIDIGPATHHNNTLGANDGTGYGVNPVTGLPYALNTVLRGDYTRSLSEFWADGPNSETPPGHWNVIANYASDNPLMLKKIGGVGPVCPRLEWDVKLYLALNGAVHDAAIACWGAKSYYDSVRPISAIRFMCQKGQSSLPAGPNYHAQGIPLVPGLIEVIAAADVQPGGRFVHLVERDDSGNIFNYHIGDIAIKAWRGQPANPSTQIGDVGWILGTRWLPYQARTFVTPPFAGYYSGHSTFSRSAAEVLSAFTGSEYFPGGFGSWDIPAGTLAFEHGPTATVQLQWARYFDAADEAGISRIFGGIHPPMDDRVGRLQGSIIGPLAWEKANRYFVGSADCAVDIGVQGGSPGADGLLDNNDFVVFIDFYFSQNPAADLGRQGGISGADGLFDNNDFIVFIDSYFSGCP
ncbi:MAG: vanadium-dependent haloperoxidase [Phycisphaerales bacterium]|nr:vanadium-dependent haloperoxidase [Phycisphaerales bacterium]